MTHSRINCLVAALTLLVGQTVIAQGPPPATVALGEVQVREVPISRSMVASIVPVTDSVLAAEQEGIVAERTFDEGDTVEAGELLAAVSTDVLEAQRDSVAASVAALEAETAQFVAERGRDLREFDRIRDLRAGGVVTEKELEDAQAQFEIAEARVLAQEARVKERKAELVRLELLIEKASTEAPIAGVIARRHVEVGQWIEQGDPVADLVQLDPLFVEVNVPEELVGQLSLGSNGTVTIPAMGRSEYEAKVQQILPRGSAGSRTFVVKLLLPNPELRLRPGFFARVVFTKPPGREDVVVPRDAVVVQGERSFVVVFDPSEAGGGPPSGTARIVPVELGASVGSEQVVRGDLSAGEKVVTQGNETLAPGQMLFPAGGGPPQGNERGEASSAE